MLVISVTLKMMVLGIHLMTCNVMEDLNKYLDSVGEPGSESRLSVIQSLNLGERSEAAKRCLEKRYRRLELMSMGHSFEISCLIVNNES